MSMTTELAQSMKAAALKATMGEWWSDVVETDGEYGDGEDRESGYHSYAVYDAQGRSLLDMTNSTAATIQTEWDRDYHLAWDVVGEHNAKHIIASQPQNVLALVESLEAALKRNAELEEKQRLIDICQGQGLEHRIAAENRAEAAEKRMAELEISRDKCFLSGLKTGWEYGIADDTEGYSREIADAQLVIDRAASAAVEGDTNANNN